MELEEGTDTVETEANVADFDVLEFAPRKNTSDAVSKDRQKIRVAHDVFIAEGVYTDCQTILSKFLALKTSTFEDFVRLWKEMKFSKIYTGNDSYAELIEFTEETLTIAKSFILPPHSQIKRIGGLYLMYGLYMQQPLRGLTKYRVTPQEWSVILKFVDSLKVHGFIDANYVFHKMSVEGAFLTVANSRVYGLGRNYRKYLLPWPTRDQELDPCNTFSLETLMGQVYRGSIKAAADKCRVTYNNIKQLLKASKKSEFQSVKGTEKPLDEVMQENLNTSAFSSEKHLGVFQQSIGDQRAQLKQKAFEKQTLPQILLVSVESGITSIASTSSNVQNQDRPVEDASSGDDSDHNFEYMMKPPSMRNSRKLKKDKKKEETQKTKNTIGPKVQNIAYEEVTGLRVRKKRSIKPISAAESEGQAESLNLVDGETITSDRFQKSCSESKSEASDPQESKQSGKRKRSKTAASDDDGCAQNNSSINEVASKKLQQAASRGSNKKPRIDASVRSRKKPQKAASQRSNQKPKKIAASKSEKKSRKATPRSKK